jgi:ABC-type transporter Mla subunit MlaD
MSPPGIPPEWSSSDYFDDDDPDWPINNIGDLREAVQKCLATAARSGEDLGGHFDALTRAAARLAQTSPESQYLVDASANVAYAADAVAQAHALLQAAVEDGRSYLEDL